MAAARAFDLWQNRGMQPTTYIWMDGELVAWDDATVHVLSHGLHYGTGAFEGIRAYETPSGTAVFRLTEQVRRANFDIGCIISNDQHFSWTC